MDYDQIISEWVNGSKSTVWNEYKKMNPNEKQGFLDFVQDGYFNLPYSEPIDIFKYLLKKQI